MAAALVFWASLAIVAYTFAGYPLLMHLLARSRPRPLELADPPPTPMVTVIVAAYNSGGMIAERVRNLLDSDYPGDRLDVIVTSDGSTDDTASAAALDGGGRVRVLDFPERRGKPACLNDAFAAATGEIVVLADSRQRFERDAIARLVRNFADPRVGAVSGELEIAPSESGVGQGIGGYWKLERRLRADESKSGSAVGCTGAIYAVRRELFRPVPSDTLIDDVVIPLTIAASGARIHFEREARAHDPQPLDPSRERQRKRRTLGGNFQMLFRHPAWLFPWGHPLWWRIASHKYLRILAPGFLVAALATNLWLARDSALYAALAVPHLGLYAAGALGATTGLSKYRAFSLPASFLFLNLMSVAGLFYYLRDRGRSGW